MFGGKLNCAALQKNCLAFRGWLDSMEFELRVLTLLSGVISKTVEWIDDMSKFGSGAIE